MYCKYEVTKEDQEKLDNTFTYHTPKADQIERYPLLRGQARQLAEIILSACPPSRERSIAITKLEESIFWANASIARNE